MRKRSTIIFAIAFSVGAVALGYIALGLLPAFIFTFGYVGGLVLWLVVEEKVRLKDISKPYWVTLGLFVVHKAEEREMDFFPRLSELTGVPVPESTSWPAILLYSMAAAWLAVPLLIKLQNDFGYYLAWTFFTSMSILELAHFVFPFFTGEPYGYFPGLATALVLAPAGWWGMMKMSNRHVIVV